MTDWTIEEIAQRRLEDLEACRKKYLAMQQERNAWRSALQSLTPGGSEFTEPHECAEYVRGNLQARWELVKKLKRQGDAAEREHPAAPPAAGE